MLASVLRLIGLDKAQEAFKLALEEKAHEAVDDVKGVVVRMVVVAALVVAAAIFALLALITGLLDLYEWMEPTYGIFLALSVVDGALAVIAVVLISAAMILSHGRPGSEKRSATPKTIEVPPSPSRCRDAGPVDSVDSFASATSAATAGDMIEPFLSVVKRYAHSPALGLLRSTTLFARWNRASSWRRRMLSRARQCSFRPGSRHNGRRSRRGDGVWLASGQDRKAVGFQPLISTKPTLVSTVYLPWPGAWTVFCDSEDGCASAPE